MTTQGVAPASGATIRDGWWNKPRTLAAMLVAEGQLTHNQICERIHKSSTWLTEIKRLAHFQERVQEIRQAIADAIVQEGIAVKVNRIREAQADYDRTTALIEARAKDDRYDEPGYSTGLMTHKLKQIGSGKAATVVDEYDEDLGVLAERRALRRAVAEEVGDFKSGTQIDVHTGSSTTNVLSVEINEREEISSFVAALAEVGLLPQERDDN